MESQPRWLFLGKPPQGGANQGIRKIFWLLPSGEANKQVTKLGNADGLLIH
jgi:hypothetical protein